MKHCFILTLTLIAVSTQTWSQTLTPVQIEDSLIKEYSAFYNAYMYHEYEERDKRDSIFIRSINSLVKNNPATLTHPFTRISDSSFVHVTTSQDGLFRIYSWDRLLGGTMHFYANIYQWKSGENVFTRIDYDSSGLDVTGGYFTHIYTMPYNGKNYYMGVCFNVYSSMDVTQSVDVRCIENKNLVLVNCFESDTGMVSFHYLEYDYGSELDLEVKPEIYYDAGKQSLFIPVVDDNLAIKNEYTTYKFNGRYFALLK